MTWEANCEKWPETKAGPVHPVLPFFSVWSWEFLGLLGSSRRQGKTSRYMLKGGAYERQPHRAWSCILMLRGMMESGLQPRLVCLQETVRKPRKCWERNAILRCLFPLFSFRLEQSWCPWISKACKFSIPNRCMWGALGNVNLASGHAGSDSDVLARALRLTSF